MSTRHLLAALLAILLFAPAAMAQTSSASAASARTPGLRARQARQVVRIRRGIESGAIDQTEARQLRAMQTRIRALARQFRQSDGRLTRAETVRLHRQLGRSSRAISRAIRGGR